MDLIFGELVYVVMYIFLYVVCMLTQTFKNPMSKSYDSMNFLIRFMIDYGYMAR